MLQLLGRDDDGVGEFLCLRVPRLGVERRRHPCAGDVETPTLLGEAP